MRPLGAVFQDAKWMACRAYLADDKVKGFTKKIDLWEMKCGEGDVSCFPLDAHLMEISTQTEDFKSDILAQETETYCRE